MKAEEGDCWGHLRDCETLNEGSFTARVGTVWEVKETKNRFIVMGELKKRAILHVLKNVV